MQEIRICKICGKSFLAKTYNSKYCSEECRNIRNRKSLIEKNEKKRLEGKICPKCGELFIPKRYGERRRYCFNCVPDGLSNGAQIRQIIKQWALDYKGGKCEICGYNKCPQALEFHHKEKGKKDFCISDRNINLNWELIKIELDKCILVCANCHREIHANEQNDEKEKDVINE